jgi:hypothetical protein
MEVTPRGYAVVDPDEVKDLSHRNEGDEPVELWAVSRRLDRRDSTKIDGFWEPSPDADQRRG